MPSVWFHLASNLISLFQAQCKLSNLTFFSTVCIGIAAFTKGGNNRGDLFSTFCESPHCQPAMLQDLFYILSPFLASEQLILFKQLVLLKFIFTFVLKLFLYILTLSRTLISKCHFLVWNQICLLGHCLVSWGMPGSPHRVCVLPFLSATSPNQLPIPLCQMRHPFLLVGRSR